MVIVVIGQGMSFDGAFFRVIVGNLVCVATPPVDLTSKAVLIDVQDVGVLAQHLTF